ncbi:unnamed protein product [Ceutorhynchus assimilis]|uniref:Uncharacterized protein n=1 Tax=Ceutorhynchus assimilis TaxID=467358 RepID=A0A9N9QLM1_9CUCU|nr:unnamed protein product [Ceutorhynchus assimilis]
MLNSNQRANIIEICRVLAEQENLKATIVESGKGALFVGLAAFMGSILAGPLGLAVGGTVSSVALAVSSSNKKYKSVVEIINEMNDDQKMRLSQSVTDTLKNVRLEDCVGLLTYVLSNATTKELVLLELANFLKREFQMQVMH